MPKRKKYPTLPNGFGSIRYLGKGRKNCFAVHPPCTDRDEEGRYIRPKALCYTDDWYVAFAVLNSYRAGTYSPGDEIKMKYDRELSGINLDAFCSRLLVDYSQHTHAEIERAKVEPTFSNVYDQFYDWKYGEKASKKLSYQSRDSTRAAYKNCSALHDRIFAELTTDDLQAVLDACTLKQASIENIKSLFTQMYKFAIPRKLTDLNYAAGTVMPDAEGDEEGVPYTEEEMKILWQHKDDPTIEFILIMCYSGFRIAAYKTLTVNLDEKYFFGGIKPKTSKERYVPIYSGILPLVERRMMRDGGMLIVNPGSMRDRTYRKLKKLGIERHTPHDCRHTFSALLQRYKVNELDRKRMLGHSFGNDVTNGVYGHRTVEELREEIEKIKTPDL